MSELADKETRIYELKAKVKKFCEDRDWEQYHHPKELAISLCLESAELLELFQWKDKTDLSILKEDKELMQELKEELADILIYTIEMANITNIDLSESVFEKLKINEKKYPIEKAKGNNRKYTEL